MWQAIRTKFNKLIAAIAAQNHKSFGNQKLDCCDLSKGQQPGKNNNKEK